MDEKNVDLGEQREWDARYADLSQLWSGRPNATLISEATSLNPGRVLDVGCGEGADALWLSEQGWQVTALDVSKVALDRAESEAAARGQHVTWLHAGLLEAGIEPGSFDLVSAQYPALARTAGDLAEHALLDAVAPGGTLLVVHHPRATTDEAAKHGFDPDDYVSPANVRALLDATLAAHPGDWVIELDETRPRHVASGAGAHHTEDIVLRARRLA
ncbi:class I SAM-dependent methyltransferase [Subtercola boreus]|uniref:Methyltransferase domain-containing protein n=1 Tax=Subtercola boreus TaxID=120213 RepID=A0A3E0WAW6_9MICO|nr:methyltransferase domain-containing protein [Subtercola boreus]RFA21148.1 hypothetical protein B7R24_07085 [Subtercola boreus]RFA21531.1 hypothetical protein B7R23_07030 [Subtercola boreus]RFA27501.1 hypothetical protein B7R25_07155 [Subtercola boreus]